MWLSQPGYMECNKSAVARIFGHNFSWKVNKYPKLLNMCLSQIFEKSIYVRYPWIQGYQNNHIFYLHKSKIYIYAWLQIAGLRLIAYSFNIYYSEIAIFIFIIFLNFYVL